MYSQLCSSCTFTLWPVFHNSDVKSRSRRPSSHTRYAMLAVSMAMYAVSAAHWALNIEVYVKLLRFHRVVRRPIRDFALAYLPKINVSCCSKVTSQNLKCQLTVVKYILSNAIVLWRAWVLWNHRPSLFTPPSIFLVCNIGGHHQIACSCPQNDTEFSRNFCR